MPTLRNTDQADPEWLAGVLGQEVASLEVAASESNWSKCAKLAVQLRDGSRRRLWLKLCLGTEFGPSEVEYYTQDYADLAGAPLVQCFDAAFEAGVGYHLLLEDLSEGFCDRKEQPPSLEHGLALADSLATLHRHHWESVPLPGPSEWKEYFEQIVPGLEAMEKATGRKFDVGFRSHAKRLVERRSAPRGSTLLHGDVNPTNVLTPKSGETPLYILDRQPFSWSLTSGLAVYDLAYATVPWWPHEFRTRHQLTILNRWHESLNRPSYAWSQAVADWELAVEHCLHVPLHWCSDPQNLHQMRGLWSWQLANITGA